MENRFSREDCASFEKRRPDCPGELAQRVYTSRLLGREQDLVLHGGGNTSLKLNVKNIVGEENEVLFVKGSGKDMASIEPDGFSQLFLEPLKKLRGLRSLTGEEMNNQLSIHRASGHSPNPSVEALLHAFLPHKCIDHTHADSILVLTNQARGEELVKEALGPKVAVLPYTMSGLPLAKAAAELYERNPDVEAMVIMHHGLFTFGENCKTAYDGMIEYVSMAEAYIRTRIQDRPLTTPIQPFEPLKSRAAATARCAQAIRGACAYEEADGRRRRWCVEIRNAPDLIDASLSEEAERICGSGVLTPDHAIRTKNKMVYIRSVPENDADLARVVREAIEAYKADYLEYYHENAGREESAIEASDASPRLFLTAGLGLLALGASRSAARIAADIGEHAIRAMLRAFLVGHYTPISDSHVFDMEYWSLQKKKLGGASPLDLEGQIAIVTGGGGAIGVGVADRLLDAGACVVIADIDEKRLETAHGLLAETHGDGRIDHLVFDVTDFPSVEKAFREISLRFGGVDIVVPNAGVAHVDTIENLDPARLDQVIAVNLTGTFTVMKAAIPIFRRQGTGGNIVLISTKNVFDPGAAFGAYSASKAGAHQLARIAALELAGLGVRVNMVSPDAVFGDERVSSGLWDLIGPDRMKSRGLDANGLKEYYRHRCLLKTQVLAEHVGAAVVFFAAESTPTTGASLPVDGGNSATFSR